MYRMRKGPSGPQVGPIIVEAFNVEIGDTQAPILSYELPPNQTAALLYIASVRIDENNAGSKSDGLTAWRDGDDPLNTTGNVGGPWLDSFSDGTATIATTTDGNAFVLLGRLENEQGRTAFFCGTLYVYLQPPLPEGAFE